MARAARLFSLMVLVIGLLPTGAGVAASAAHRPLGASRVILAGQTLDAFTAALTWDDVIGAQTYELLRDGRLIDRFPAGGAIGYTDHLLWPSTAYAYELRAVDTNGVAVADVTTSVSTPPRSGNVQRFYSSTSFWNTLIRPHPTVDPGSAAMVNASVVPYRAVATINLGNQWGIPLAYASSLSQTYQVGCLQYGCETTVSFRIPAYATPNLGSDGHLAVMDLLTGHELDLWQGSYDPTNDTWEAGSRTDTAADWGAACPIGTHCGGGGTGAGFLEFGGVIRPEEIAQGHIDHALVISTPYIRSNFIACPGTNPWSSQSPQYQDDPNALPLGAHVQLDPRIKVAHQPWARWEKIVARALQKYGAYVADVSGSLELRGEANLDRGYDAWAKVGITSDPQPSLENLPWNRLRVLSVTAC